MSQINRSLRKASYSMENITYIKVLILFQVAGEKAVTGENPCQRYHHLHL